MPIVTQSASVSYSPFPALPAPSSVAGLLPAPVIGGLLAAGNTPVPRRYSRIQAQFDLWAAQDAEIREFLDGARSRLLALRDELWAERQMCHA